eukprot:CAMPEP_0113546038 /NCGR_PEP_ID=MMETSP0015_2-20120614/11591_1 /TAXON_ID=2838 /ORGANISM="Odontella" /LENGTH=1791 /DNA_ID=CAMNT_0000446463 /DNA_START=9 /DNA_END=5381 /DNA_ORIENTATION=- /assembly_acc=CAM_ASM_000160
MKGKSSGSVTGSVRSKMGGSIKGSIRGKGFASPGRKRKNKVTSSQASIEVVEAAANKGRLLAQMEEEEEEYATPPNTPHRGTYSPQRASPRGSSAAAAPVLVSTKAHPDESGASVALDSSLVSDASGSTIVGSLLVARQQQQHPQQQSGQPQQQHPNQVQQQLAYSPPEQRQQPDPQPLSPPEPPRPQPQPSSLNSPASPRQGGHPATLAVAAEAAAVANASGDDLANSSGVQEEAEEQRRRFQFWKSSGAGADRPSSPLATYEDRGGSVTSLPSARDRTVSPPSMRQRVSSPPSVRERAVSPLSAAARRASPPSQRPDGGSRGLGIFGGGGGAVFKSDKNDRRLNPTKEDMEHAERAAAAKAMRRSRLGAPPATEEKGSTTPKKRSTTPKRPDGSRIGASDREAKAAVAAANTVFAAAAVERSAAADSVAYPVSSTAKPQAQAQAQDDSVEVEPQFAPPASVERSLNAEGNLRRTYEDPSFDVDGSLRQNPSDLPESPSDEVSGSVETGPRAVGVRRTRPLAPPSSRGAHPLLPPSQLRREAQNQQTIDETEYSREVDMDGEDEMGDGEMRKAPTDEDASPLPRAVAPTSLENDASLQDRGDGSDDDEEGAPASHLVATGLSYYDAVQRDDPRDFEDESDDESKTSSAVGGASTTSASLASSTRGRRSLSLMRVKSRSRSPQDRLRGDRRPDSRGSLGSGRSRRGKAFKFGDLDKDNAKWEKKASKMEGFGGGPGSDAGGSDARSVHSSASVKLLSSLSSKLLKSPRNKAERGGFDALEESCDEEREVHTGDTPLISRKRSIEEDAAAAHNLLIPQAESSLSLPMNESNDSSVPPPPPEYEELSMSAASDAATAPSDAATTPSTATAPRTLLPHRPGGGGRGSIGGKRAEREAEEAETRRRRATVAERAAAANAARRAQAERAQAQAEAEALALAQAQAEAETEAQARAEEDQLQSEAQTYAMQYGTRALQLAETEESQQQPQTALVEAQSRELAADEPQPLELADEPYRQPRGMVALEEEEDDDYADDDDDEEEYDREKLLELAAEPHHQPRGLLALEEEDDDDRDRLIQAKFLGDSSSRSRSALGSLTIRKKASWEKVGDKGDTLIRQAGYGVEEEEKTETPALDFTPNAPQDVIEKEEKSLRDGDEGAGAEGEGSRRKAEDDDSIFDFDEDSTVAAGHKRKSSGGGAAKATTETAAAVRSAPPLPRAPVTTPATNASVNTSSVPMSGVVDDNATVSTMSTMSVSTMGRSTLTGATGRTEATGATNVTSATGATGMTGATGATGASTRTVRSRRGRRRRGAARARLAQAKEAEAEVAQTKRATGWMESIKAAAADSNRRWDPKVGWVDYAEPDTEVAGVSALGGAADPARGGRAGRIGSLSLSVAGAAVRRKMEEEIEAGRERKNAERSKSVVPFPSDWEKERESMLSPAPSSDREDEMQSVATEKASNSAIGKAAAAAKRRLTERKNRASNLNNRNVAAAPAATGSVASRSVASPEDDQESRTTAADRSEADYSQDTGSRVMAASVATSALESQGSQDASESSSSGSSSSDESDNQEDSLESSRPSSLESSHAMSSPEQQQQQQQQQPPPHRALHSMSSYDTVRVSNVAGPNGGLTTPPGPLPMSSPPQPQPQPQPQTQPASADSRMSPPSQQQHVAAAAAAAPLLGSPTEERGSPDSAMSSPPQVPATSMQAAQALQSPQLQHQPHQQPQQPTFSPQDMRVGMAQQPQQPRQHQRMRRSKPVVRKTASVSQLRRSAAPPPKDRAAAGAAAATDAGGGEDPRGGNAG